MSVYIGSHETRGPDDLRLKYAARMWAILIGVVFAALLVALLCTPGGRRLITLYRQPTFLIVGGLVILQFIGVGLYAFMYPQNRKSVRNRLLMAFLAALSLPALAFGMRSDFTHAFGQAGVAIEQCLGPAASSFQSSAIPQVACLQAWNTPYAVVERRKIAEYSQKECLKQEDEKISGQIQSALGQVGPFDSKEKVVSAFRANNVPLETADGQTYFSNIYTSCLDSLGYDKNAQFKVVVLASFTAGALIRDVTVSSSNASPFNSLFAKNGIAESYRVDFETKRRVASVGQNLVGLMSGKSKSSSGVSGDVALSNLSLSCSGEGGACSPRAVLSGAVLNQTALGVHAVAIAWGISRNGKCDQSMTEAKTVSFASDDPLREQEQRSFAIDVAVPYSIGREAASNLCGTVARID